MRERIRNEKGEPEEEAGEEEEMKNVLRSEGGTRSRCKGI